MLPPTHPLLLPLSAEENILGQYSPDSKLCTGVDFVRNAKIPSIDFATVHLWCAMGGGTRAERQVGGLPACLQ